MKRKMLQFSAERAAVLDQVILACGYPTEKKKMFGHEVHFLNGYMFSGANVRGVFVHLGQAARDEALEKESGVSLFEPLEGTVMKEYLLLEAEIADDPDQLKKWLDRAAGYLSALPPKQKKKKKPNRKRV